MDRAHLPAQLKRKKKKQFVSFPTCEKSKMKKKRQFVFFVERYHV
jgi:hypothetical protein